MTHCVYYILRNQSYSSNRPKCNRGSDLQARFKNKSSNFANYKPEV